MLQHDGAAPAYAATRAGSNSCSRMQLALIDDAKIFNDKFRGWEDYYNYRRAHGGLGGQTPTSDSEPNPHPV